MPSYLVTGCSRGLGLALIGALADLPDARIFATSRSPDPNPALQALITTHPTRITCIPLDITSSESLTDATSALTAHLGSAGLDVLINSAATQVKEPAGLHSPLALTETVATNVLAPHNTILAFLPLLRQGNQKKIINISSTLGSLALAKQFAFATDVPSYKISKAALNMLGVLWGIELEKEGFTVVSVSPGWMRTELGGVDNGMADLSPEEGARAVVEVVQEVGRGDNGGYRDICVEGSETYRGGVVPW